MLRKNQSLSKFIIDDPDSAVFEWFQMGVFETGLPSRIPRKTAPSRDPRQSHFCLLSPKLLPFVQPMTFPYFPIRSATSTIHDRFSL